MLEIGIGTGPNLKYYANGTDIEVFGIDPNMKMEKYATAAAVASRLPLTNFKFIHAVCNTHKWKYLVKLFKMHSLPSNL